MWRRLRSSPSMVVAVVSLVVALLCVLYVMERPGTIAIGSPTPDGIRVIDADFYNNMLYPPTEYPIGPCGSKCNCYKVWDEVEVTVPAGKQWVVIVTEGVWDRSWGLPPYNTGTGYCFEIGNAIASYSNLEAERDASRTYSNVNLYIFACDYENGCWKIRQYDYIVLEIPLEFARLGG